MFLADARKRCDHKVREFVDCSKREGLAVVWKCREENKNMNACVSDFTTDDEWSRYRADKIAEFLKNGQIIVDSSIAYPGPPK